MSDYLRKMADAEDQVNGGVAAGAPPVPNPAIRFIRFELPRKRPVKGGMIDARGYFATLEEAAAVLPDDADVEIYDAWTGEVHTVGYDGGIS